MVGERDRESQKSTNSGLTPGTFWAFNAGAAEFLGGLMLLLGALTRVGAALNVVTMSVAVLLVHRSAFFADQGGMEFPLLLLAASATLLIAGGGAVSVDHALTQPAQRTAAVLENYDTPKPVALR